MQRESEEEEADPVLCLQHCQKGVRVLCLAVPDVCPVCHQPTASTPADLPPFRLPSPFMAAGDAPYSVVVRPTVGSFLRHYANDADLHVGITDSKGTVYEYDSTGIHVSSHGWSSCLAIQMIDRHHSTLSSTWTDDLRQYSLQPAWTAARYSEQTHHCYDFVLGFLRWIELDKEYPCVLDSGQFCAELIVPKTAQAAKYIALYRRLLKDGPQVQGNVLEYQSTYL